MAKKKTPSRSRRSIIYAGTAVGALILAAGAWLFFKRGEPVGEFKVALPPLPPPKTTSVEAPKFSDFAGAESCAECHADQYRAWANSTHGKAGGTPGKINVLPAFDGKPLVFKDATVIPKIAPNGDYLFQIHQQGAPEQIIKVDAVVGGGHMFGGGTQSFFHQHPDGTMRFLPFDFIRKENVWFVQLRADKSWVPVTPELSLSEDLANWPPNRVLGSMIESSNCQNCHGSQIHVSYDMQQRRYNTKFQTLQIDCESCHGPAKRHIDIVRRPDFEASTELGLKSLATLGKEESLTVCFRCHATKDQLRDEPYLPGADLAEYFSLKLALFDDAPFFPDGRIRAFGYQSSHYYSDCYLNGSMTCVDCHDPHSQGYRDVFKRPLQGKFDNGQCTGCHASKALNPEQHTHHRPASAGSLCTACHMPYFQHQAVGKHLVFARSDHTVSIPRPRFDNSLGMENACQQCHRDQSLEWQEQNIREWYGEVKPHPPAVQKRLNAENVTNILEALNLLDAESNHHMAQMDALSHFVRQFLKPGMQYDKSIAGKLMAFSRNKDEDVKAVALMALHIAFDEEPTIRSFITKALSDAGAVETRLRARWAVAADQWANDFAGTGDMRSALVCVQKGLEIQPDNVVLLSHLGQSYFQTGQHEKAEEAIRRAIGIKPHQASLHFQLAQMYYQLQRLREAIRSAEQGMEYAPFDLKARGMLEFLRALERK